MGPSLESWLSHSGGNYGAETSLTLSFGLIQMIFRDYVLYGLVIVNFYTKDLQKFWHHIPMKVCFYWRLCTSVCAAARTMDQMKDNCENKAATTIRLHNATGNVGATISPFHGRPASASLSLTITITAPTSSRCSRPSSYYYSFSQSQPVSSWFFIIHYLMHFFSSCPIYFYSSLYSRSMSSRLFKHH